MSPRLDLQGGPGRCRSRQLQVVGESGSRARPRPPGYSVASSPTGSLVIATAVRPGRTRAKGDEAAVCAKKRPDSAHSSQPSTEGGEKKTLRRGGGGRCCREAADRCLALRPCQVHVPRATTRLLSACDDPCRSCHRSGRPHYACHGVLPAVHCAIVVFITAGLPLILIGAALHWSLIRIRWLRALHLGCESAFRRAGSLAGSPPAHRVGSRRCGSGTTGRVHPAWVEHALYDFPALW